MARRLLFLVALPVWVACGSGVSSEADTSLDTADVAEVDDLVQTDIAFTCKEGATEPCGSAVGLCEPGVRVCTDGLWGTCQGGVGPSAEACNGDDDDCDGATDEEYTVTSTACGTGACKALGTLACVGGAEVDSCTPGQPAVDDATCDAVDDDCDGATDEDHPAPVTTCGVGACATTGNLVCDGGQTHDTCQAGSAAADDPTCDGVDDDCDGVTDESYVSITVTCGRGACLANGTTVCAGGAVVDSCSPGGAAGSDPICNGLDDDCDGLTDDDYAETATLCGVGACAAAGQKTCVGGAEVDTCAPGQPSADDATCDGLDDDCSGTADEDFAPAATSCGAGACAAEGWLLCEGGLTHDTCKAGTGAPGDATCDGVDDDCDGAIDDDYQALHVTCGVGACLAEGTTVCVEGAVILSCSPGGAAGSDPICNGLDDDCDGLTDDDYVPTPTACGVGACVASGEVACVQGGLVDTCTAGQPATLDATCDGLDDDCDGTNDEDFLGEQTSCGVGACAATGSMTCVDGQPMDTCAPGQPAATIDDDCDGVDNDCDGLTDEDDLDDDGDGVGGGCSPIEDNCPTVPNFDQIDTDNDGLGDACDPDDDDDGVPDLQDNCPFVPNPLQETGCVEGVGAACSPDEDCDGVMNDVDNCPLVANTDQVDTDNDGVGDACDPDCDGDGVDNANDNCPCTAGDPGQQDYDGDGQGDACDPDDDNDGVPDVDDCGPFDPTVRPGAPDVLCDGVDDDCDGTPDDGYVATATTCGVGACAATGQTSCVGGATLDSCTPGAPGLEVCNGQDDDCNGLTDAADAANITGSLFHHDQPPCEKTAGVCAAAKKTVAFCKNGAWMACTDAIYAYWDAAYQAVEGAACDAHDNDCDGGTDEGYVPTATSCGVGACAATGQRTCVAGAEVDSCAPGLPAPEVCNGLDDSCDGVVDDGGDALCSLEQGRPAACVDGGCRVTCNVPSDCLWSDWLVDCLGSWACTQGLCREQCGGSCGNGVCEPAKGEDAWTCSGDCKACVKSAECGLAQFCEFGQGACQAPGSCLNLPLTCPLTWAPVCGCDGLTYGNACLRRQAGVGELHAGECKTTACETAADCLGSAWQVKCYGHWTCVGEACTPECGAPCGDGTCDPAKGEDAATCAPDCTPPKPTAFRADTLALVAPTLCLPMGGAGCLDVTEQANVLIANQLVDANEPLDLVTVFTPLDLASTSAAFDLLDATCQRDPNGTIVLCGPTTGDTPNVFASPVFRTDGACVTTPSTVVAPCFSATSQDARFRLLGVLFGLLDPLVAGSFVFDSTGTATELTPGLITGFLPQSLAVKLQFDIGLGVPLSLADLLAHVPTVVHEGAAGWWMTFEFSAVPVPYGTTP